MPLFREGAAHQQALRFDAAEASYRAILAAAPDSPEAWTNLGSVLQSLRRFDEAEAAHDRALALRPAFASALYNRGNLLSWMQRWNEAEAAYRQALAVDPGHPRARLNLGYVLLGEGRFLEGLSWYEARKDVPGMGAERLAMPEWTGQPLDGRSLLIWPEQGLGDQIQFARYAPVLRDLGADVTLVCLPPLAALFEGLGVKIVALSDQTAVPRPDYWTLPLSIPLRLQAGLDAIPPAPYLHAPDDRRRKWAGLAPSGGVGFVWRGNPAHKNDRNRSLPSPGLLAPLKAAGAALVDLQTPRGDFADTAAILEGLDLVVTVDTATAHLAGALGKPCWVMLPYEGLDWRWMHDRSDTPWYPSMRLFRQPRAGDWASVVAEMVEAWRART